MGPLAFLPITVSTTRKYAETMATRSQTIPSQKIPSVIPTSSAPAEFSISGTGIGKNCTTQFYNEPVQLRLLELY